jgi:hypothetical protein
MNLHNIATGYVSAVNPPLIGTLQTSTGYKTNADGTRVPTYAPAVQVSCQVQALQYNDIVKLQGLNIQGVRHKLYINGKWEGIVRADQRGGDLLTMPDGTLYLVAMVLENWPDWCSVAVTEQVPQ